MSTINVRKYVMDNAREIMTAKGIYCDASNYQTIFNLIREKLNLEPDFEFQSTDSNTVNKIHNLLVEFDLEEPRIHYYPLELVQGYVTRKVRRLFYKNHLTWDGGELAEMLLDKLDNFYGFYREAKLHPQMAAMIADELDYVNSFLKSEFERLALESNGVIQF